MIDLILSKFTMYKLPKHSLLQSDAVSCRYRLQSELGLRHSRKRNQGQFSFQFRHSINLSNAILQNEHSKALMETQLVFGLWEETV